MREYPNFAAIPTITENNPEGILAGLYQFLDSIDLVLQAMRIAGVPGSKIRVANPLPIERDIIEAMGRDIQARGDHLFAQRKGCAHIGTGVAGGRVLLPIWLDPLCQPVRCSQQPHFPPARLTPGRGAIMPIPRADPPGAALAAV